MKNRISDVHKTFQKTNISQPLKCSRTCFYQGVRNIIFKNICLRTKWMTPNNNQTNVGFISSFQFRKYTDEDITKNYDNNDIVVSCGRAALCLLLITSYPLLIVPCRATINKV